MEAEVCRIGNHQMCLKTNYRVLLFYEIFFKNIYYFNLNGKIMIFNYSKYKKVTNNPPLRQHFGKQMIQDLQKMIPKP